MNKYAMVPICSKEDLDGTPIIRRVLIGFEDVDSKIVNRFNFLGTRFIDCDPYFLKTSASHKYSFSDTGYKLINYATNINSIFYDKCLYEFRPYHFYISSDTLRPIAIMFEADSDEEAKKRFHQREEKRD